MITRISKEKVKKTLKINEIFTYFFSISSKGVAVCSTRQFFTKLEEDKDDDDGDYGEEGETLWDGPKAEEKESLIFNEVKEETLGI